MPDFKNIRWSLRSSPEPKEGVRFHADGESGASLHLELERNILERRQTHPHKTEYPPGQLPMIWR